MRCPQEVRRRLLGAQAAAPARRNRCDALLRPSTPLLKPHTHPLPACSDIVGFRAPYLATDEQVRKVLHDEGFLYDR